MSENSTTLTGFASRALPRIWGLSWPQVLMMLFHFFIGFVDVYVAGRISRDVQAGMGMLTQSLFFFMVVAVALANGSVAAISQSHGAGLARRAKRYVQLCLASGIVLGATFCLVGLQLLDPFLTAIQTPRPVYPIAQDILRVFLFTLPSYYMLIITNAVFRARQQVMYPLYSMICVTGLNTLGDFGLGLGMFGLPRLEHIGLAWATFGSITAGMLVNLAVLTAQGMTTWRDVPPLRWVRKASPYLLKVAFPAGLMQLVWHSAYLALFAVTGSLPQGNIVALAAFSAGVRIESILFLPGFAFNMTASILVGEFLGRRDVQGARRMGVLVLCLGVALISLLAAGVWNFLPPLIALVASDAAVQAETTSYLAYNLAAMPFLLTAMILGGVFTGAGATFYQMLIFGVSAWGIRLPLAWVLGHAREMGAEGIWMAMLISMAVQALLMLLAFLFLPWQRFALRKARQRKPVPPGPLGQPRL